MLGLAPHFVPLSLIAAILPVQSRPTAHPRLAHDAASILLWASLLFGAFLLAAFVIVRFSRRFRRVLLRPPAPPTASDDVWTMHRLPNNEDVEP